jgi:hypothetical protein
VKLHGPLHAVQRRGAEPQRRWLRQRRELKLTRGAATEAGKARVVGKVGKKRERKGKEGPTTTTIQHRRVQKRGAESQRRWLRRRREQRRWLGRRRELEMTEAEQARGTGKAWKQRTAARK